MLIVYGICYLIFRNVLGSLFLPTILFVASLHSNISRYFDDIKREKAGVTKHKFNAKKVYDLLAPNDSVSSSLLFELGSEKFLLINGQWIFDEEVYGGDSRKYYDDESAILNCLTKPYSFPSSEFEIWISNLDNKPSKIVFLGNYLKPQAVNWPTPEKYFNKSFALVNKHELATKSIVKST